MTKRRSKIHSLFRSTGFCFPDMDIFLSNFANLDSLQQIYPLLLQGLRMTILLSIVSLPLGLLLGVVIAVAYSLHIRPLNAVLLVYIDLFRSFPVIVLLVLLIET